MDRDKDVQTLAIMMHSRLFPYIRFSNPPIRTSPSACPAGTDVPAALAGVPVMAEPPRQTAGTGLQRDLSATVAAPAMQPPASVAIPMPPNGWSPNILSGPVGEAPAASFPLIRMAVQEARAVVSPPPTLAVAEGTFGWLRIQPSAAQV